MKQQKKLTFELEWRDEKYRFSIKGKPGLLYCEASSLDEVFIDFGTLLESLMRVNPKLDLKNAK